MTPSNTSSWTLTEPEAGGPAAPVDVRLYNELLAIALGDNTLYDAADSWLWDAERLAAVVALGGDCCPDRNQLGAIANMVPVCIAMARVTRDAHDRAARIQPPAATSANDAGVTQ